MVECPAYLNREETDAKFSDHIVDIINRLLSQNPLERLGALGIIEIKKHPWLRLVDWKSIEAKTFVAPFIPKVVFTNIAPSRVL